MTKSERCAWCKRPMDAEMIKAVYTYFAGDEPCFCKGSKRISNLVKENKRLKQDLIEADECRKRPSA